MKYFPYSLPLLAILAYGAFNIVNTPAETPISNRLETKYGPSDEFFMQRAYPDGQFSIAAYTKGLHQAREAAQGRSEDGFDNDWTTQGPGNIGARINTIAVDPNNEDIIFIGFGAGGVWKTTNGGADWTSIFDDQLFLSIGDIVIDPNDNTGQTIYVGTGDPNISGYPKIGDGLYKSTDGGATWQNLGLTDQRIISEIIVDPHDANVIYAAAMGLPFEKNDERGLYKSTDAGNSWNQILFLSDSTGVTDIVMDPFDSQVLYAAGWDRIRNNRVSEAAGLGAKVYKTIDGGTSWELMEGGLPNDSRHSRIGLAISQLTPGLVYIQYTDGDFYQFEDIYKTTDAGTTWEALPNEGEYYSGLSDNALGGFGWYFGKLRVSPTNDNDLYLLGVDLWRTSNNGSNWARATPDWFEFSVHADKHDLVFTPSGKIILATDGGLYRADANGSNWEDIENIPTTQFYRVAYNPHVPEFYYGGAQDNGSTGGNAAAINNWARIFGGDGFQMAFDPDNSQRFFCESQNGNIVVTLDDGYTWTGATDGIANNESRSWDMPYIISPHDPQILYTGTDKVYAGFGDVPFWSPISQDLSDGTAEQHRYHHITAINESPLTEGLLYAGTGDGNLWRSFGLGSSWSQINAGLPDQYVTDVVASPNIADNVYVTFSGYRDNDNLPRLHRSEDQGETWEDISVGLPELAINDLLILPGSNDSLLFVATDGGVYGTLDAGASWKRLGANMPYVLVYDLAHNVVRNELVAGTFARSIMSFPLDSLMQPVDSVSSVEAQPIVQRDRIKVYPSPASDVVQLEFENIEPGRSIEMVVLDAAGRLVERRKSELTNYAQQLDVSDWPSGKYFVKVKMRHEVWSTEFSVVH